MNTYRMVVEQVEDTARLAQLVAERCVPGVVLALDGDLGAGKTTFSQKLAVALGVSETVNSPTFSIIKEYEGASMPFYHMDVYRIDVAQAEQLGLDEYFFGAGVTLIEWASLIAELLPANYLHIQIFAQNPASEQRVVHLTPYGERYQAWCESWRLATMLDWRG